MRRLLLALFVASAAISCASGAGAVAGGTAAGDAVGNAALGAGVSVYRRTQGECYTPCVQGTTCNKATGTCDPLPCRGACAPTERCDESGILPKCVADGSRIVLSFGDAGTAAETASSPPP